MVVPEYICVVKEAFSNIRAFGNGGLVCVILLLLLSVWMGEPVCLVGFRFYGGD